MGIAVVIVAYDSGPRLVRCLDSLAGDAAAGAEVVVVNNGARGEEIEWADELDYTDVLEAGGNVGFAEGATWAPPRRRRLLSSSSIPIRSSLRVRSPRSQHGSRTTLSG
jgi:GT2 family glycosyltransferase